MSNKISYPILEALSVLAARAPDYAAYLYSRVDVIEADEIQTAATDGRRMFFNTRWFGALPLDERVGVIAHEVQHDMLDHPARMRAWRQTNIVRSRDGSRTAAYDHATMNIAMDAEINASLRSDGFRIPAGGVSIPHVDANPHKFTAEEIYFWLLDNAPGQGQGQNQGQGQGQGQGRGEELGGRYGRGHDEHRDPDPADKAAGTDADRIDREAALRDAAAAGRRAGKQSGSFERLAEELLKPKVDWRSTLRDLIVQRIGVANYDFRRFSRRAYATRGTIEPARRSVKCPPIAFIVDTSGSIIHEAQQFLGEVACVAQELAPERIDVVWTDYSVQHVDVLDDVSPDDVAKLSIRGGGGTDLRRGFEWIAENHSDGTAAIVVLTDSQTPWPDTPPECPVIVATTGPNLRHPEWMILVDMTDGAK